MHALAKLKARAEADEAFDARTVKIATKDFSPRYWLRWAHGVGKFVHLWGKNGIGFSLPRGEETPECKRSEAALMAAYSCPGNGKKLRRYLAKLVPEYDKYIRADIRWRSLMAKHAPYLPVVKLWKGVQVSADVSIPEYVFSESAIDADNRNDEFKRAKKLELADRRARYERQIKYTPPSRQAKFNAAWRAVSAADKAHAQSNEFAKRSTKKFLSLQRTHRPLPIAGGAALAKAA